MKITLWIYISALKTEAAYFYEMTTWSHMQEKDEKIRHDELVWIQLAEDNFLSRPSISYIAVGAIEYHQLLKEMELQRLQATSLQDTQNHIFRFLARTLEL